MRSATRLAQHFMLALLILAAGCARMSLNPYEHELREQAGPPVTEQEADAAVKAHLANVLKDPDSLKQYQLRGVYKSRWIRGIQNGGGSAEGWLACFEYNAKNSYGGHVGLKRDGMMLRKRGDTVFAVPEAMTQIMTPNCQ